jgi:hypothetical protein
LAVRRPHTVDLGWLEEAGAPILACIDPYVRALVAGGPAPEVIASGVLASYRGRPVLLTAKHALDGLEGRPLFVDLADRFEPVPLPPGRIAVNEDADAAVVVLPPAARVWNLPFVDLESQDGTAAPRGEGESYVAMGFPWRESTMYRTQGKLDLTLVRYWGVEDDSAYGLLRLRREDFVVTSFDQKNCYRGGVRRQMKRPHGMSGGGLWRLTGERIELAGILTRYEEENTKSAVSARVGVLQKLASELTRKA